MYTGKPIRNRFLALATGSLLLFASGAALAATTVRFSVPPWPGAEVKAEVASQVLKALGYQTTLISLAPVIGIKSVAAASADVTLDVWVPSEKPPLDAAMKTGNVVIVGTNLPDALYGMVVPDYVWKAGVHSIGDLHKHAAKFDSTIYGIDAGSPGNMIMVHAIDKNTYDLHGWKVVPSTTAAMLAEAKQRIEAHQWVTFLGWRPHWMNVVYHLKYLKDPKGIWGHDYVIDTIANKQFIHDNPNVARFLKQIKLNSKTQSAWIYDLSFKKMPQAKVAKAWLDAHPKIVEGWLKGVKTADGKSSAASAFAKAF